MALGYFNLHLASGYIYMNIYIYIIYEYPIATIHLLDIFCVALNLQKPRPFSAQRWTLAVPPESIGLSTCLSTRGALRMPWRPS